MHISLDSALGRQRRLNSVGESVFQIAPDAAAGYSLRSLTGGDPSVVRVRRESDNGERDFRSSEINSGAMVRWVNEQITPPLDLRELTATGRDGPIIEAAAAYSLRNLSDSYAGDVVEVRRNTDGALKDFKASEVTDGTLEAWVNTSFANALPLDTASGAAAAYSLRNLSSSYTGSVVEVRRSSDDAVRSFTAAEVTDGTLTTWVLGDAASLVGKAQYFNGTSSEVTFASATNLNPELSDFEVEQDVYITDGTVSQQIISKGNKFSNQKGWSISISATSGLVIKCNASNNSSQRASTSLSNSTRNLSGRHTVGLKLDRTTNKIIGYLDGDNAGFIAGGGGPSSDSIAGFGSISTTNPIIVGSRGGTDLFLEGATVGCTISKGGVDSLSYTGLGATPFNDIIGSNNGTPSNVVTFTGQGFDGTVSKWYDQSGNDKHAVQGTPASQPKIVNAGALVIGGLDFDGVADVLETSLVPPNVATLIGVANWDVINSTGMIAGARDEVSKRSYLAQVSTGDTALGVSGSAIAGPSVVAEDDYLLYGSYSGSTRSLSTNGVLLTDELGNVPNNTTQGYSIGAFNDAGTNSGFMNGTIQEVIVYPSDESDKRRAIEENIGSNYGITLPSSKDGTVSKWYDQSTTSGTPNANHAVQTDAAKQPKIVSGGSLVTGGLDFDAVNDYLSFSTSFSISTDFAIFGTLVSSDFSRGGRIFHESGSDNIRVRNSSYDFRYRSSGVNYDFGTGTSFTNNNQSLFSFLNGSDEHSLFVNGALKGQQIIIDNLLMASISDQSGGISLGGAISELIIYNSDQTANRTALEANIGEVYGIAGIPAYDDTVNGFVETWYDQSGNGRNATQLTAGSQPKIVDAGVYLGELDFDGTDDNLALSGSGLDLFRDVGYGQIFSVITPDNVSTGNNRYFEAVSGSSGARLLLGDSQDYAASSRIGGRRLDADGFQDIESPTSHSNNETLITGFLNWADADAYLYLNGTERASSTGFQTAGNTSDTRSQEILISGLTRGDFKTKEIIIYNTDQTANRPAIEANINNQYDIY